MVREAIGRLADIEEVGKMCEQVAEDVFEILGYDRVMVYRFAEDFHGEVVAERSAENIPDSYLGLHFPATDLPQRIRDQYLSERVRMIVDAKAEYTPIIMA